MSLCTVAEYKLWRGIAATTWDATVIPMFITTATAAIERLCGRTAGGFESAAFAEVFDGDGTQTLRVSNGPITSISSISFGNATLTAQTLTDFTDDGRHTISYVARSSRSSFAVDDWGNPAGASGGDCFPLGYQNVTVEYVGGYGTIPDDLKLACYRFIDHYMSSRGRDMGISTQGRGNTNYTRLTQAEFDAEIHALLRPWRQIL